MEGSEHGANTTNHAAVRVCGSGGQLELRFDRGFDDDDVAAVKAIPGRRWRPDQLVWMLPDTNATRNALKQSFGSRLQWSEKNAATDAARPSFDTWPSTDSAAPGDAGIQEPAAPTLVPCGGAAPAEPGLAHDAECTVEAVRSAIRLRGYSRKTERAYVAWTRRFLRFHAGNVDRPEQLTEASVRAFLEHLASKECLAAKSRNQAASALAFMFREVLGRDDELAGIPRAKGPRHVPVVLSHREVLRVFRELTGKYFLIAVILYSAGLRIQECLQLRVKDIDFELRQILVRDGKGRKDRYVPLAQRAIELLREQLKRVAGRHEKDRSAGHGWAPLPGALHRKDPMAGYEPGWQFVFPASTVNKDPVTQRTGRWPLHITAVQREIKAAVRRSAVTKRATCHTFRHSFATEALRTGCDIRTLQHVMGHKDIRTTMIYLHVLEQSGFQMRSPLDRFDEADEYEPDPIGKPLAGISTQWQLAASQWAAPPRHLRKGSAPATGQSGTRPGPAAISARLQSTPDARAKMPDSERA